MTIERQGEVDLIINFITELSLSSLLLWGIKIWQSRDYEIIIDLILVSEKLADIILKCMIYKIEYSSDYHIIIIVFDISVLAPKQQEWLLFKNIS